MNKKITLFVYLLFISSSLFAEENDGNKIYVEPYFSTSNLLIVSMEPIETDYGATLGFEVMLESSNSNHLHLIGIDYNLVFVGVDSIIFHNSLQWYYCFLPELFKSEDFILYPLVWNSVKGFPFGINMIYNFNNGNFYIGPKISWYFNIAIVFFSLDYSYNISINDYKKNHQISLKIGSTLAGFF